MIVGSTAVDAAIIGAAAAVSYGAGKVVKYVSSKVTAQAGNPFEPNQLGMQRGVDPSTLQTGGQSSLELSRLNTQSRLIRSGTPRNTPITVNQHGVIIDGHHGVRAAIEAGRTVDVHVIRSPMRPGAVPVWQLPIR